jgi:hypothetical protein
MIPVGYMRKRVVTRPDWLKADTVDDIYAVSGCISEAFADYIQYWKHNGYWFFNSPGDIEKICRVHDIDASGDVLFYYEVFERQFDAATRAWLQFAPEASFPTHVEPPGSAHLAGYDVTTFSVGTSPECSPLSCNSMATDLAVNRHCLFDTFEAAVEALESGKINDCCEPGPFRIFAVYTVET